jgi:hypothetical protein
MACGLLTCVVGNGSPPHKKNGRALSLVVQMKGLLEMERFPEMV